MMSLLTQQLLSISAMVMVVGLTVSGERFSLRGKPYPNHGLVLRDLIGENDGDPDNRLHCISDLADCCSPGTMFRGEFYYPDGSKVQSSINDPYYGIYYRSRGSDRIFLNRHNVMGVIIKEGLFRCQIRSLSSPITPEDYYIGVYTTASGSPNVTNVTPSTSQTLTCTSSGGPATKVTWRRNCVVLSPDDPNYQQSQMVTQMQTATYENTLMINNITDTDGLYTCSVFNMMGYSSGTSGMGDGYIPRLPVNVNIISYTPVAGQSFTLRCHVTSISYTYGHYQWILPNGSKADGDYFASDKYTLTPLLESHTGEYSCQFTLIRGADKLFGCGVKWINVQAPSVLVSVDGTDGVTGTQYTLTCSVVINGVNIEPPDSEIRSVMYTWLLRGTVVQQSSTSNKYITKVVQMSNSGDVYTCQVWVAATYWDVSGSFEGSGSGTLTVKSNSSMHHLTGKNVLL